MVFSDNVYFCLQPHLHSLSDPLSLTVGLFRKDRFMTPVFVAALRVCHNN